MRQDRTLHKDVRANALWGRRGESRSNALWGRSGKRTLVLLSLAAMLVVPVAGSAAPGVPGKPTAVVPDSLIAKATPPIHSASRWKPVMVRTTPHTPVRLFTVCPRVNHRSAVAPPANADPKTADMRARGATATRTSG